MIALSPAAPFTPYERALYHELYVSRSDARALQVQLRKLRRKFQVYLASQAASPVQPLQSSSTQSSSPAPTVAPSSTVTQNLLCIHGYEGAWNDNTGNGYYGGLQMDYSFMQTYGPEFLAQYGSANNWPVADQLTAGARAVAVRGYTPWPNTAAMCGL